MSRHPVLNDQALEIVARRFAVLAEPMRLRLIQALFDGEKNVTELVEATGGTQANISRHLSLLTQQGLVERESRGTSVYYKIADDSVYALCDLVCDNIARQYERAAKSQQALFARAEK